MKHKLNQIFFPILSKKNCRLYVLYDKDYIYNNKRIYATKKADWFYNSYSCGKTER